MSPATIDFAALQRSITQGVIDGNKPIIDALLADGGKRHDLRQALQQNTDKVWEMDGELKLIKGWLITLMGNGDGNGGMVNRIDRDMTTLSDDVAGLKAQVAEVNKKLDSILPALSAQKSFTDGWKGVSIALGIIATCLSIIGGIGAGIIWLFQSVPHK